MTTIVYRTLLNEQVNDINECEILIMSKMIKTEHINRGQQQLSLSFFRLQLCWFCKVTFSFFISISPLFTIFFIMSSIVYSTLVLFLALVYWKFILMFGEVHGVFQQKVEHHLWVLIFEVKDRLYCQLGLVQVDLFCNFSLFYWTILQFFQKNLNY